MTSRGAPIIAAALSALAATALVAAPALISRWSFDEAAAANAVTGGPTGTIQRAVPADGHAGKALAFEDWSVKNYLKPDPAQATRVVVPHEPRLNPVPPFRVSAWIYATADPVYYGGIVEKGHGYGASYRLVLLRGLKVEATAGERHVSVRTPSLITLNSWHEVSLVVHGTWIALVVDGKEAARASLTQPSKLSCEEPLIIGERFTGRIDEVSISAE